MGGFFMSKEYRSILKYEREILELRKEGLTRKEIANRLGLKFTQIKDFIKRYNQKQEKIEKGILPNKKGRPTKDYIVNDQSTVSEFKYILARKEAKIKSLEMENELMRDFLSLTGRK